jgi:hypothetical protein
VKIPNAPLWGITAVGMGSEEGKWKLETVGVEAGPVGLLASWREECRSSWKVGWHRMEPPGAHLNDLDFVSWTMRNVGFSLIFPSFL